MILDQRDSHFSQSQYVKAPNSILHAIYYSVKHHVDNLNCTMSLVIVDETVCRAVVRPNSTVAAQFRKDLLGKLLS